MPGAQTRRSAARRRPGPRFRMTVLRLTRRAVHRPVTGRFFPQAPFSSGSCGGQSGHESAGGKAHRSRGRLVEGVVRRLHRRHGPHSGPRFPRRPVRVGVGSRGRRGAGADPAPGPADRTALRCGADGSGAPHRGRRRTGHAPPLRSTPAARPVGAAAGPAPRPHELPDRGETPRTDRAAPRPRPHGRTPGRHNPTDRSPQASGHEPIRGRLRQACGRGYGRRAFALFWPPFGFGRAPGRREPARARLRRALRRGYGGRAFVLSRPGFAFGREPARCRPRQACGRGGRWRAFALGCPTCAPGRAPSRRRPRQALGCVAG